MKKTIFVIIVVILIVIGIYISFHRNITANAINSNNNVSSGNKNVKEFEITAKQFSFNPETIEVNEGDIVRLKIRSADVVHSFYLPDFGINEMVNPGKTTEIEFLADKKGTFYFACSVYCGEGHGAMIGKLIVR